MIQNSDKTIDFNEKLWYGTDVLICKRLEDMAPSPGVISCPTMALTGCFKGNVSYRINYKPIEWKAPSISLLMPGNILEFMSASPDFEGCVIAISPNFLKNIPISTHYQTFGIITSKPTMSLNDDDMEMFQLYFNLTYRLMKLPKNAVNDTLLSNVLQSFLNYFLFRYEDHEIKVSPEDFRSRSEYLCCEFMKLTNRYAAKKRELDFYANELHISEKYLSNVVKRVTQKSPSHWIRWAVVQQASSLLFDMSKSIQQISDELEFSTPSHFTSYFKKERGCTPKEYRKNLGK